MLSIKLIPLSLLVGSELDLAWLSCSSHYFFLTICYNKKAKDTQVKKKISNSMAKEMNIDDKINSRQQNTTLKPTDWTNEHNKKRVDFFLWNANSRMETTMHFKVFTGELGLARSSPFLKRYLLPWPHKPLPNNLCILTTPEVFHLDK